MQRKNQLFSGLLNTALLALCFALLAGCAVKRDHYNVPEVPLPERYAKAPTVTAATHSNSKSDAVSAPEPAFALSGVLAEWWRLLGSSELDTLIDRVLANNSDLHVAALRIAQLRIRLDQANADKNPEISLPAQASNVGPYGGVGTVAPGGQIQSRRNYQVSVRGDWRPDIWGERSAMYESAELQLWRATFQRDDVQRNVVNSAIVTYAEYLSLNDRLRVARETDKALSDMLAAVDARLEKGDATVTEMEQQKTAVYSVRATIPVLQQQREVVVNRLAFLAGTLPGELKLSDSGLDSVSFPVVLPGVPSALLLRRPDVRVAEARLLAADADIDMARARVLPPLDLTAQVGYGSAYLSQMFQPQTLFWNAIANLSLTLFDSGKRSREVDFTRAVHEELVETYVRVIYDAVREVDDSLGAVRNTGSRLDAQQVAADSAHRAWTYSQESYKAGAVDHLVALDAERTYHRNLDDLYIARMERYRGLVNLFSALGGGVSLGGALPGDGARPLPLTAEIDYGAVVSQKPAKPNTPAALGAEVDVSQAQAGKPVANVATLPGTSDTPSINLTLTASLPSREEIAGLDWSENLLSEDGEHWLVEVSGVHDRDAISVKWRDLRTRYAKETEKLALLPHRQGRVESNANERVSWYRFVIAKLPDRAAADALCETLREARQRCQVISSNEIGSKDNFNPSSLFRETTE